MKSISVLIAEDHTIVRQGFRKMLELEPDLVVVGEASDGRKAAYMAKSLEPDVIMMDIAMPLLNGLESTRQILKSNPSAKVLILSAYNDDEYVKMAVQCGASGFLLKQSSFTLICQAIREVHSGKTFYSPPIIRRIRKLHSNANPSKRLNQVGAVELTSREIEVLQLIAEGKANKESSVELGISLKTVEKHREHLMRKLDIHDTAGLTRYAISVGIIESSVRMPRSIQRKRTGPSGSNPSGLSS